MPPKDTRLLSLDVFRGAAIASMILVNDPGDWGAVYPPLLHADWHGWTFTDLVFPFFLWIAGVALTFSFAKRVERGDDRRRLALHVLRRSVIIFAIGMLLNGFPHYRLATIRIPGVLQRIAICYLVAGLTYLYTGLRGQVACIVALLAGYWMVMTLAPVPGYGPGVLAPAGNFAQWIDARVLAGHMWSHTKTWDPEGIVTTIPAIATTLFGILTGRLLRAPLGAAEKTAWMLAAGNVMIFAGLALHPFLPINKNLWTSTFSIFMAGMAMVVFGVCFWIVDVQGWTRGTKPFVVFGMNAIAVYVFAGLLARILGLAGWQQPIYRAVFAPIASPRNASLLYALAFVAVCHCFCRVLYRRRWFLKF